MANFQAITKKYPVMKMHGCGNDFVVLYDLEWGCQPRRERQSAGSLA